MNARAETKRPLFVAINEGAGADTVDMPKMLATLLRDAGHEVVLFEIPKGASLENACKPLVMQALNADGVVVAAGGDGTVNAIAKLCYEHKVTLAVIPLGTFNYFARALGIPTKLEDAVAAIGNSTVREVSAGFVQEHLFLNNASFGLYPKLIKKREAATKRFGRKRIIGAVSAIHSLFERQTYFSIACTVDGTTMHNRTNMVFVGNNSLQLETLGLDVSACAKANRLAAVILTPLTRLQMARLMWRGIVKNLHFENKLQQFCTDDFTVETKRPKLEVVIDGEIITCQSPLAFRVEAKAIRVLAPMVEGQ